MFGSSTTKKQIILTGCLAFLIILTVVDTGTLIVVESGKLGVLLWILSFLLVAVYAVLGFGEIIRITYRYRTPLTLVAIGLLVSLALLNMNNPKSLSGETTQEIACIIRALQTTKDWGFHQTCFFGYPARQYIVPALPSIIFGKTMSALHLGGALYFFLGLIIFARGTLVFFSNKPKADALMLFFAGSLLHFYYVNHFLFLYEQSIYPLSFALSACGIWMHYQTTRNPNLLTLFGIVLLWAIFSYTPSLALLPLGIIFLVSITKDKNQQKMTRYHSGIILAIICIAILLSLTFRRDLILISNYPQSYMGFIRDMSATAGHIFFKTMPYPFTSPLYTFVFLGMMLLPFSGAFGRWAMGVSIWTIMVFFAVIASRGYQYYSLEFRIHRLLVIVPVLFTLLAHMIKPYFSSLKYAVLVFIAVCITITGLLFYQMFEISRPINTQYPFIMWLSAHTDTTRANRLYLLYGAHEQYNLVSLRDTMQYFYPKVDVFADYDDRVSRADCSLDRLYGIIVLPMDHPCAQTIDASRTFSNTTSRVGKFSYKKGPKLLVVQQRK